MKIKLFKRHYGVHSLVKEIDVPLKFAAIVKKPKNANDDFIIDEDSVLENIPAKWLSVKPDKILLTVGEKWGSTAQRSPKRFRGWGKYFDAYSLELAK
jgi:hypothetical protein